MISSSGMTARNKQLARHRVLQACELLLAHPADVHYTQGPNRWQGIDDKLIAAHGHCITEGDCSSTATWVLWNALYVPFRIHDIVNGEHWQAGYTGTIGAHGNHIRFGHERIGDLVLYGPAPRYEHVAVCVGGGLVMSHGSEGGPYKIPIHYRADAAAIRRFI